MARWEASGSTSSRAWAHRPPHRARTTARSSVRHASCFLRVGPRGLAAQRPIGAFCEAGRGGASRRLRARRPTRRRERWADLVHLCDLGPGGRHRLTRLDSTSMPGALGQCKRAVSSRWPRKPLARPTCPASFALPTSASPKVRCSRPRGRLGPHSPSSNSPRSGVTLVGSRAGRACRLLWCADMVRARRAGRPLWRPRHGPRRDGPWQHGSRQHGRWHGSRRARRSDGPGE